MEGQLELPPGSFIAVMGLRHPHPPISNTEPLVVPSPGLPSWSLLAPHPYPQVLKLVAPQLPCFFFCPETVSYYVAQAYPGLKLVILLPKPLKC
jgi:hypothetical protein